MYLYIHSAAPLIFPFVLRWTGALSVADIERQSPQHTRAFLRFCFVLAAFLWICFFVAFVGIRRRGSITWQQVVRAKWNRWQTVIRDQNGLEAGAHAECTNTCVTPRAQPEWLVTGNGEPSSPRGRRSNRPNTAREFGDPHRRTLSNR
jgi:hypothetical protein